MDINEQKPEENPEAEIPEQQPEPIDPVPALNHTGIQSASIQKPGQTRYIAGLIIVSLIGIITVIAGVVLNAEPAEVVEEEIVPKTFVDPYEQVSVGGQAVMVLDLQTGETLFSKNASTSLPLASVTKLMSAYTALEHAPNILSITIDPTDIMVEGDQGLIIGETWRLDDLLDFSLVTSSNDGMHAIARSVGKVTYGSMFDEDNRQHFIDLMNQSAQDLGLTTMTFLNETGLDEATGKTGGVGSAHDVAQLIGQLVTTYPDAVTRTRDDEFSVSSLSGLIHVGRNTNIGAAAIPGLLASKTGFTDLAGGNLAIVYNHGLNRPIAIVVLGSTPEGRFVDVETLVEATQVYFQSQS